MRNGRGHSLEKVLVHGRMSTVTGIRLVVQVVMWMSALDDGGLARIGIEAKHFCGLMIDPDEGVVMICHGAMVARDWLEGHPGLHVLVGNTAPVAQETGLSPLSTSVSRSGAAKPMEARIAPMAKKMLSAKGSQLFKSSSLSEWLSEMNTVMTMHE